MTRLTLPLVTLALLALAPASASAQPACGEVITQDTTLTADLDCPTSDALVIGAPGITLDLGGHGISTNVVAIRNAGHDDVTIRNGTVYGDTLSILLEGVTGNTIRDIELGGLVSGIRLVSSDRNRIESNHVRSAGTRIDAQSDYNVVRDNVIAGYEGNISASGGYNRIVDNVIWSGSDGTLGLSDAHHTQVRRNAFVTSYVTSVSLLRAHDNIFADNHFVEHEAYRSTGLVLSESSRNRFARNRFGGLPQAIWVRSGADNVFARNVVEGAVLETYTEADPDGFLVDAAATGTVLQANVVGGFADDGIDVRAPGTRITRNGANDNGDLGIEAVAGVVDGGGNTASGNGNPLQCVNVFCAP